MEVAGDAREERLEVQDCVELLVGARGFDRAVGHEPVELGLLAVDTLLLRTDPARRVRVHEVCSAFGGVEDDPDAALTERGTWT